MKKDFKKISNEELENVSGGRCQTFSKQTYADINATPVDQDLYNHPLIVTAGNHCPSFSTWTKGLGSGCLNCQKHYRFVPMYCLCRSKERDPYR